MIAGDSRIIRPLGKGAGACLSREDDRRVSAAVKAGGVVVFPTESFYALGADPLSPQGLEKVFRLKGRAGEKTVLLLLDGRDRVDRFADGVPEPCRRLMEHFWPGPLTLLFPARRGLPGGIVSSRGEVALRVPGSPLGRAVATAAGGALTGTSANASGAPPADTLAAARLSLRGEADFLVEGGTLPGGGVSTLLALREGRTTVIRDGAVSLEEIEGVLAGAKGGL